MSKKKVETFLQESLGIEGIFRAPYQEEIEVTEDFIFLVDEVEVKDLLRLLKVYQPNAKLRSKDNVDVRVGSYFPPKGGKQIEKMLNAILKQINNFEISPFEAHCEFEKIHPFTDGNGRTGRALWAWHMHHVGLDPFGLTFLHNFYYQSLTAYRRK